MSEIPSGIVRKSKKSSDNAKSGDRAKLRKSQSRTGLAQRGLPNNDRKSLKPNPNSLFDPATSIPGNSATSPRGETHAVKPVYSPRALSSTRPIAAAEVREASSAPGKSGNKNGKAADGGMSANLGDQLNEQIDFVHVSSGDDTPRAEPAATRVDSDDRNKSRNGSSTKNGEKKSGKSSTVTLRAVNEFDGEVGPRASAAEAVRTSEAATRASAAELARASSAIPTSGPGIRGPGLTKRTSVIAAPGSAPKKKMVTRSSTTVGEASSTIRLSNMKADVKSGNNSDIMKSENKGRLSISSREMLGLIKGQPGTNLDGTGDRVSSGHLGTDTFGGAGGGAGGTRSSTLAKTPLTRIGGNYHDYYATHPNFTNHVLELAAEAVLNSGAKSLPQTKQEWTTFFQFTALNEQLLDYEEENIILKEHSYGVQVANDEMKLKITKLEREMAKLEKENAALKEKHTGIEGERARLEDTILAVEYDKEQLCNDIAKAKDEHAQLVSQNRRLHEWLEAATDTVERWALGRWGDQFLVDRGMGVEKIEERKLSPFGMSKAAKYYDVEGLEPVFVEREDDDKSHGSNNAGAGGTGAKATSPGATRNTVTEGSVSGGATSGGAPSKPMFESAKVIYKSPAAKKEKSRSPAKYNHYEGGSAASGAEGAGRDDLGETDLRTIGLGNAEKARSKSANKLNQYANPPLSGFFRPGGVSKDSRWEQFSSSGGSAGINGTRSRSPADRNRDTMGSRLGIYEDDLRQGVSKGDFIQRALIKAPSQQRQPPSPMSVKQTMLPSPPPSASPRSANIKEPSRPLLDRDTPTSPRPSLIKEPKSVTAAKETQARQKETSFGPDKTLSLNATNEHSRQAEDARLSDHPADVDDGAGAISEKVDNVASIVSMAIPAFGPSLRSSPSQKEEIRFAREEQKMSLARAKEESHSRAMEMSVVKEENGKISQSSEQSQKISQHDNLKSGAPIGIAVSGHFGRDSGFSGIIDESVSPDKDRISNGHDGGTTGDRVSAHVSTRHDHAGDRPSVRGDSLPTREEPPRFSDRTASILSSNSSNSTIGTSASAVPSPKSKISFSASNFSFSHNTEIQKPKGPPNGMFASHLSSNLGVVSAKLHGNASVSPHGSSDAHVGFSSTPHGAGGIYPSGAGMQSQPKVPTTSDPDPSPSTMHSQLENLFCNKDGGTTAESALPTSGFIQGAEFATAAAVKGDHGDPSSEPKGSAGSLGASAAQNWTLGGEGATSIASISDCVGSRVFSENVAMPSSHDMPIAFGEGGKPAGNIPGVVADHNDDANTKDGSKDSKFHFYGGDSGFHFYGEDNNRNARNSQGNSPKNAKARPHSMSPKSFPKSSRKRSQDDGSANASLRSVSAHPAGATAGNSGDTPDAIEITDTGAAPNATDGSADPTAQLSIVTPAAASQRPQSPSQPTSTALSEAARVALGTNSPSFVRSVSSDPHLDPSGVVDSGTGAKARETTGGGRMHDMTTMAQSIHDLDLNQNSGGQKGRDSSGPKHHEVKGVHHQVNQTDWLLKQIARAKKAHKEERGKLGTQRSMEDLMREIPRTADFNLNNSPEGVPKSYSEIKKMGSTLISGVTRGSGMVSGLNRDSNLGSQVGGGRISTESDADRLGPPLPHTLKSAADKPPVVLKLQKSLNDVEQLLARQHIENTDAWKRTQDYEEICEALETMKHVVGDLKIQHESKGQQIQKANKALEQKTKEMMEMSKELKELSRLRTEMSLTEMTITNAQETALRHAEERARDAKEKDDLSGKFVLLQEAMLSSVEEYEARIREEEKKKLEEREALVKKIENQEEAYNEMRLMHANHLKNADRVATELKRQIKRMERDLKFQRKKEEQIDERDKKLRKMESEMFRIQSKYNRVHEVVSDREKKIVLLERQRQRDLNRYEDEKVEIQETLEGEANRLLQQQKQYLKEHLVDLLSVRHLEWQVGIVQAEVDACLLLLKNCEAAETLEERLVLMNRLKGRLMFSHTHFQEEGGEVESHVAPAGKYFGSQDSNPFHDEEMSLKGTSSPSIAKALSNFKNEEKVSGKYTKNQDVAPRSRSEDTYRAFSGMNAEKLSGIAAKSSNADRVEAGVKGSAAETMPSLEEHNKQEAEENTNGIKYDDIQTEGGHDLSFLSDIVFVARARNCATGRQHSGGLHGPSVNYHHVIHHGSHSPHIHRSRCSPLHSGVGGLRTRGHSADAHREGKWRSVDGISRFVPIPDRSPIEKISAGKVFTDPGLVSSLSNPGSDHGAAGLGSSGVDAEGGTISGIEDGSTTLAQKEMRRKITLFKRRQRDAFILLDRIRRDAEEAITKFETQLEDERRRQSITKLEEQRQLEASLRENNAILITQREQQLTYEYSIEIEKVKHDAARELELKKTIVKEETRALLTQEHLAEKEKLVTKFDQKAMTFSEEKARLEEALAEVRAQYKKDQIEWEYERKNTAANRQEEVSALKKDASNAQMEMHRFKEENAKLTKKIEGLQEQKDELEKSSKREREAILARGNTEKEEILRHAQEELDAFRRKKERERELDAEQELMRKTSEDNKLRREREEEDRQKQKLHDAEIEKFKADIDKYREEIAALREEITTLKGEMAKHKLSEKERHARFNSNHNSLWEPESCDMDLRLDIAERTNKQQVQASNNKNAIHSPLSSGKGSMRASAWVEEGRVWKEEDYKKLLKEIEKKAPPVSALQVNASALQRQISKMKAPKVTKELLAFTNKPKPIAFKAPVQQTVYKSTRGDGLVNALKQLKSALSAAGDHSVFQSGMHSQVEPGSQTVASVMQSVPIGESGSQSFSAYPRSSGQMEKGFQSQLPRTSQQIADAIISGGMQSDGSVLSSHIEGATTLASASAGKLEEGVGDLSPKPVIAPHTFALSEAQLAKRNVSARPKGTLIFSSQSTGKASVASKYARSKFCTISKYGGLSAYAGAKVFGKATAKAPTATPTQNPPKSLVEYGELGAGDGTRRMSSGFGSGIMNPGKYDAFFSKMEVSDGVDDISSGTGLTSGVLDKVDPTSTGGCSEAFDEVSKPVRTFTEISRGGFQAAERMRSSGPSSSFNPNNPTSNYLPTSAYNLSKSTGEVFFKHESISPINEGLNESYNQSRSSFEGHSEHSYCGAASSQLSLTGIDIRSSAEFTSCANQAQTGSQLVGSQNMNATDSSLIQASSNQVSKASTIQTGTVPTASGSVGAPGCTAERYPSGGSISLQVYPSSAAEARLETLAASGGQQQRNSTGGAATYYNNVPEGESEGRYYVAQDARDEDKGEENIIEGLNMDEGKHFDRHDHQQYEAGSNFRFYIGRDSESLLSKLVEKLGLHTTQSGNFTRRNTTPFGEVQDILRMDTMTRAIIRGEKPLTPAFERMIETADVFEQLKASNELRQAEGAQSGVHELENVIGGLLETAWRICSNSVDDIETPVEGGTNDRSELDQVLNACLAAVLDIANEEARTSSSAQTSQVDETSPKSDRQHRHPAEEGLKKNQIEKLDQLWDGLEELKLLYVSNNLEAIQEGIRNFVLIKMLNEHQGGAHLTGVEHQGEQHVGMQDEHSGAENNQRNNDVDQNYGGQDDGQHDEQQDDYEQDQPQSEHGPCSTHSYGSSLRQQDSALESDYLHSLHSLQYIHPESEMNQGHAVLNSEVGPCPVSVVKTRNTDVTRESSNSGLSRPGLAQQTFHQQSAQQYAGSFVPPGDVTFGDANSPQNQIVADFLGVGQLGSGIGRGTSGVHPSLKGVMRKTKNSGPQEESGSQQGSPQNSGSQQGRGIFSSENELGSGAHVSGKQGSRRGNGQGSGLSEPSSDYSQTLQSQTKLKSGTYPKSDHPKSNASIIPKPETRNQDSRVTTLEAVSSPEMDKVAKALMFNMMNRDEDKMQVRCDNDVQSRNGNDVSTRNDGGSSVDKSEYKDSYAINSVEPHTHGGNLPETAYFHPHTDTIHSGHSGVSGHGGLFGHSGYSGLSNTQHATNIPSDISEELKHAISPHGSGQQIGGTGFELLEGYRTDDQGIAQTSAQVSNQNDATRNMFPKGSNDSNVFPQGSQAAGRELTPTSTKSFRQNSSDIGTRRISAQVSQQIAAEIIPNAPQSANQARSVAKAQGSAPQRSNGVQTVNAYTRLGSHLHAQSAARLSASYPGNLTNAQTVDSIAVDVNNATSKTGSSSGPIKRFEPPRRVEESPQPNRSIDQSHKPLNDSQGNQPQATQFQSKPQAKANASLNMSSASPIENVSPQPYGSPMAFSPDPHSSSKKTSSNNSFASSNRSPSLPVDVQRGRERDTESLGKGGNTRKGYRSLSVQNSPSNGSNIKGGSPKAIGNRQMANENRHMQNMILPNANLATGERDYPDLRQVGPGSYVNSTPMNGRPRALSSPAGKGSSSRGINQGGSLQAMSQGGSPMSGSMNQGSSVQRKGDYKRANKLGIQAQINPMHRQTMHTLPHTYTALSSKASDFRSEPLTQRSQAQSHSPLLAAKKSPLSTSSPRILKECRLPLNQVMIHTATPKVLLPAPVILPKELDLRIGCARQMKFEEGLTPDGIHSMMGRHAFADSRDEHLYAREKHLLRADFASEQGKIHLNEMEPHMGPESDMIPASKLEHFGRQPKVRARGIDTEVVADEFESDEYAEHEQRLVIMHRRIGGDFYEDDFPQIPVPHPSSQGITVSPEVIRETTETYSLDELRKVTQDAEQGVNDIINLLQLENQDSPALTDALEVARQEAMSTVYLLPQTYDEEAEQQWLEQQQNEEFLALVQKKEHIISAILQMVDALHDHVKPGTLSYITREAFEAKARQGEKVFMEFISQVHHDIENGSFISVMENEIESAITSGIYDPGMDMQLLIIPTPGNIGSSASTNLGGKSELGSSALKSEMPVRGSTWISRFCSTSVSRSTSMPQGRIPEDHIDMDEDGKRQHLATMTASMTQQSRFFHRFDEDHDHIIEAGAILTSGRVISPKRFIKKETRLTQKYSQKIDIIKQHGVENLDEWMPKESPPESLIDLGTNVKQAKEVLTAKSQALLSGTDGADHPVLHRAATHNWAAEVTDLNHVPESVLVEEIKLHNEQEDRANRSIGVARNTLQKNDATLSRQDTQADH